MYTKCQYLFFELNSIQLWLVKYCELICMIARHIVTFICFLNKKRKLYLKTKEAFLYYEHTVNLKSLFKICFFSLMCFSSIIPMDTNYPYRVQYGKKTQLSTVPLATCREIMNTEILSMGYAPQMNGSTKKNLESIGSPWTTQRD